MFYCSVNFLDVGIALRASASSFDGAIGLLNLDLQCIAPCYCFPLLTGLSQCFFDHVLLECLWLLASS